MRGPAIAKWARHLGNVWSDKPYTRFVTQSEANLLVYENLTGVPHSIIATAAAAANAEEAAELRAMLAAERTGYAATRHGSTEEAAAAAAVEDSETAEPEPIGSMTGIDEFEVQIATTQAVEQSQLLQAAAQAAPTPTAVLANGGKLVSCTGHPTEGFGDYSPFWPLLVHPECFPHGVGHKPDGMSLKHWVQLLLARKGFADNVPFTLHMFDILQRHETNTQTYGSLRSNSAAVDAAGAASVSDMAAVLEVLQAGGRGNVAQRFAETASPAAKAMLRAYRATGVSAIPHACRACHCWHVSRRI